ncbi:MAG TPA: cation:proton antiporter [Bacteroidales bacterium]|nr:cation:proton antiporter [Bacteroidales bacterium]
MDLLIFKDITLLFGIAVLVLFVCQRLRIPPIIGYLATGVLAGPNGFSMISSVHEVEMLAEIGVILLLFTIGIEFSLKSLLKMRKTLMIGGGLQVVLSILFFYGVMHLDLLGVHQGEGFSESLFMGFLMALSSTAIVLKLLQERGEFITPHGRTTLGILIFQDIAIVPMILVLPFLASGGGESSNVLEVLAKVLGVLLIVFLGARYVVPRFLYQVVKTRSRELFLLTIIVLALSVAYLTSLAGLSLALGAFLAGLIISESDYSQQAFGNVLPFLDVFTSFFFVSIGMLLDVGYFIANPVIILVLTLGVIVAKTFIATLASLVLGFPLRTSLMVGLMISQVGEFSFILSRDGQAMGLISEVNYQLFLSVSVLTMAVTPFIIAAAPRIGQAASRLPLPRWLISGSGAEAPEEVPEVVENHLVIVGYGVNGRNVARAAQFASIPYRIIEMNPSTVREEKHKGIPILFGDASQEVVLKHAHIQDAMVLVITLPGSPVIRRITQLARSLNPHLHIIIRARFLTEMQDYYQLGANEVIPEEFETSIEIFTRVLAKYLVPIEKIEKLVAMVRSDGYEMFRSLSVNNTGVEKLSVKVPDVSINTIQVGAQAAVNGKNLAKLELKSKHRLNLLAVSRGNHIIANPPEKFILHENDILFFLASKDQIAHVAGMFKSPVSDIRQSQG